MMKKKHTKKKIFDQNFDEQDEIMKKTQCIVEVVCGDSLGEESFGIDKTFKLNNILAKMIEHEL